MTAETLVSRLRADAERARNWPDEYVLSHFVSALAPRLDEAADRLDELTGEVAEWRGKAEARETLLAIARTERDRLREAVRVALPFVAGVCVGHPDAPNHQCAHTHRRTLAKLIGDQSPWVSLLTKDSRSLDTAKEER